MQHHRLRWACRRGPRRRRAKPQRRRVSLAGTYLAANFAAAQGDVKAATGFYANSLKDDPGNADLLERTFLFAAEAGDIDQAIGLTDRVLMQDPDNRPAHLVREVGALVKKDYAAVIKDVTQPSTGLFAALTNRVIEAWARAGSRDVDGALNALDSLSTQRGVDGLRLMHRALILDYAGRDKDADEAYKQAVAVMGTGPRAADAYGRFLVRHGRADEARALYQRMLKDNPGNPVAQSALRDIAAKKTPQPLVGSPAEGVSEAPVRHCRLAERSAQRRCRDPLSQSHALYASRISIWPRCCSPAATRRCRNSTWPMGFTRKSSPLRPITR